MTWGPSPRTWRGATLHGARTGGVRRLSGPPGRRRPEIPMISMDWTQARAPRDPAHLWHGARRRRPWGRKSGAKRLPCGAGAPATTPGDVPDHEAPPPVHVTPLLSSGPPLPGRLARDCRGFGARPGNPGLRGRTHGGGGTSARCSGETRALTTAAGAGPAATAPCRLRVLSGPGRYDWEGRRILACTPSSRLSSRRSSSASVSRSSPPPTRYAAMASSVQSTRLAACPARKQKAGRGGDTGPHADHADSAKAHASAIRSTSSRDGSSSHPLSPH
jgi:hypothetical protein